MMQQNDPGQGSHHLRENASTKHVGGQSEISIMNAQHASHLKRNAEAVAGEDFVAVILENGVVALNNQFCSSQMSTMCQGQVPRSGGRLMDNPYRMNSIGSKPPDSLRGKVGNISPRTSKNGLIRHSSSPPGLLSRLAVDRQTLSENGYPVGSMRGMANVTIEDGSCGAMTTPNRLGSQTDFLRQSSSPAGLMSQVSVDIGLPEMVEKPSMPIMGSGAENQPRNDSDDDNLANGVGSQGCGSNFSAGSWEDATMFPGNFPGMQSGISFAARKRLREFNGKLMPSLSIPETQNQDPRNHGASALINHQFSLPKSTISEIAIENLLQNSIPCKIRAKRGFATHPRSIAERVRRTRISERMRKLQELVPNMDKQTNTTDMLDEAVEYIKLLQKQVQELSMNRSECNGSCKRNSDSTANV